MYRLYGPLVFRARTYCAEGLMITAVAADSTCCVGTATVSTSHQSSQRDHHCVIKHVFFFPVLGLEFLFHQWVHRWHVELCGSGNISMTQDHVFTLNIRIILVSMLTLHLTAKYLEKYASEPTGSPYRLTEQMGHSAQH